MSAAVCEELGLDPADRPPLVTTVGSHDTASAVVGVPAVGARLRATSPAAPGAWSASSWDAPVLTEDGRAANFTNERGVDGTIRYLRNVMGLWLLSESIRWWNLRGAGSTWGAARRGRRAAAGGPRFDPTTRSFLPPGDMPARIAAGLPRSGSRCASPPESSGASSTASPPPSPTRSPRPSGSPATRVEVVHIVGGGSQNALLCRLTADACRRPVVAGPVEATALGNLLVQARTHGVVAGDLAVLRGRIRRRYTVDTVTCRGACTPPGRGRA